MNFGLRRHGCGRTQPRAHHVAVHIARLDAVHRRLHHWPVPGHWRSVATADMELQLGALEGDVVAQVVHLAVDLKAGLHVLLLWAERNRDSRVSSAWIWTASSRQQPVRLSWS